MDKKQELEYLHGRIDAMYEPLKGCAELIEELRTERMFISRLLWLARGNDWDSDSSSE